MQLKPLSAALALLACHTWAHADTSNTELEEVVITATRISQNPLKSLNDVSIITRQDISNSNAQSLPELLQQSIGIETMSNGNSGGASKLYLRGTNSKQVVVLIDGIRTVSATLGEASYNHIPLSQIDRIEVVRGSASSVYGADAIGGVVQIFTRKPQDDTLHGSVGAKVGTEGQRGMDANIGGRIDKFSYQVSAGTERTDGGFSSKKNDPLISGYHPDEDGYRNHSISGRLTYEWADGHEISASALRVRGNVEYDNRGSSNENNITDLSQFSIASRDNISDNISSLLLLSSSQDKIKSLTNGQINPAYGGTYDYYNSKNTTAQWILSGNHETIQWQIGSEWLKQQVESGINYERNSRINRAYFAALNANHNKMLIESSLRQDRDSQYGHHTTGRLALGYQITDQLVGRVGYGTAFRVPTFNDLYAPMGWGSDPHLKPEQSRSWEAGLKYRTGIFAADWTVFHNSIKNMLVSSGDPYWQMQNANKAKLVGTSLSISKQWQELKLYANATYQDPIDKTYNKLLPQRARVFGNIGIDYQPHEQWKLNANMHVHGRSFADAANTDNLGGYTLLNAGIEYQPNKQWSVKLSGTNLLDKQYTTVRGYNTLGRSVLLSGRYAF